MPLFFGENQYFYKKNKSILCNLTGKVFKIYSLYLSYLNLMLHCSTYIYSVMYTYDTRQNIFVFRLKIGPFNIEVYFGKCVCSYNIYI